MEGSFEHLIYTHIGEYRTLRSKGVPLESIRELMSKKPDFDGYPEGRWIFQQSIDDHIAIGQMEKATDQSRPFIHYHLALVKPEEYEEFGVHPWHFHDHFMTYKDCMQRAVDEELEPLKITMMPYPVNADAFQKYGDEKKLVAILDSVIEAAEGRHRLKWDFRNVADAVDFLYPILALAPAQLRMGISFCVGAEPKNPGMYSVLLRVNSLALPQTCSILDPLGLLEARVRRLQGTSGECPGAATG
ncbi:MAG: hypothetical protein NTU41_01145 [Chloroflexi bacterium]|nr:hypothetical protein [Chloroflexota bacterium]